MPAARKREKETANERLASAMEAFTQQHPDWEQQLDQIMENADLDIPKEAEPTLASLSRFLAEAAAEVRCRAIEETEILKLFPQNLYPLVQDLLNSRLKIFHAFVPLCALYEENRSKAENLIDQIWQQYVVRFNPNRKIERPNNMTDEDMSDLECALDAFADFCIVRMFHYDAIVQRIKQTAGLPDDLCAYIARKIERDYQDLRMNYIISRLEQMESQEEETDNQ